MECHRNSWNDEIGSKYKSIDSIVSIEMGFACSKILCRFVALWCFALGSWAGFLADFSRNEMVADIAEVEDAWATWVT